MECFSLEIEDMLSDKTGMAAEEESTHIYYFDGLF